MTTVSIFGFAERRNPFSLLTFSLVPQSTSVAKTGIPKLIASIIVTGIPSAELRLMKISTSKLIISGILLD